MDYITDARTCRVHTSIAEVGTQTIITEATFTGWGCNMVLQSRTATQDKFTSIMMVKNSSWNTNYITLISEKTT